MLLEKWTPVASGVSRSNRVFAGPELDLVVSGVECMVPEVSVAACVVVKVTQQESRTIIRVIHSARHERCPFRDNKGC